MNRVEAVAKMIGERSVEVQVLQAGGSVAEILPMGFTLYRFAVAGREIVYSPPLTELIDRPTRGGMPILFPFPNRIRAGQFRWSGQEYSLPRNDSNQVSAIHGFSPRVNWQIAASGTDADSAWIRGIFSSDAADDGRRNWPGSYRLSMTIRLFRDRLNYVAQVENPGASPLPFGLGYHPYFLTSAESRLSTPAAARWELVNNLPTSRIVPVADSWDLRQPRLVRELQLDDVYTELPRGQATREIARLTDADGMLSVFADSAFRELVLFTPPHKQAVAIEPYTCPTDAINLPGQPGWLTLEPGKSWQASVEYRWSPRSGS